MKKTMIFAIAGAAFFSSHALADTASLKENYVAGAFSDADDNWRRIVSNKVSECGTFGKYDTRRIDILISRYEKLGDALNGGDEATIKEAANSFNTAVTTNDRFEKCWDTIARKKGLRNSFKRAVSKS